MIKQTCYSCMTKHAYDDVDDLKADDSYIGSTFYEKLNTEIVWFNCNCNSTMIAVTDKTTTK